jgi:hypothetical protein
MLGSCCRRLTIMPMRNVGFIDMAGARWFGNVYPIGGKALAARDIEGYNLYLRHAARCCGALGLFGRYGL